MSREATTEYRNGGGAYNRGALGGGSRGMGGSRCRGGPRRQSSRDRSNRNLDHRGSYSDDRAQDSGGYGNGDRNDSLERNYKVIRFGQGKAHLVFDEDLIREVEEQVVQKSRIRLHNGNKYYKTLDQADLSTLSSIPHKVTFSLNKRPGYLYLFKYRGRPTCLYIREKEGDRHQYKERGSGDSEGEEAGRREKSWDYIIVKHRFGDRLYDGTLFQGEFVQVNKFQHLFLIGDLCIYRGRAHLADLPEKIRVLQEIFRDKFTPDPGLDTHQLLLKEYCEYDQILDFATNYRMTLPYQAQITGLIFRPHIRNQKSIVVVLNRRDFHRDLPEFDKFRANEQQSQAHTEAMPHDNGNGSAGDGEEDEICADAQTQAKVLAFQKKKSQLVARGKSKVKIDASKYPIVRFRMLRTDKPDVYELWLKDSEKKYGIATIPTLALSQQIRTWYEGEAGEETREILVEAEYVKSFNKWKPIRVVGTVSGDSKTSRLEAQTLAGLLPPEK